MLVTKVRTSKKPIRLFEQQLTETTLRLVVPQYVPGASYRHLEFLLGRISNLGEVSDFTTQHGNYTGKTGPC
jgi:hypothetical protein